VDQSPADVINAISVCSGGAGLELGVALALGQLRTRCYVEREAHAISYLLRLMDADILAQAPVWTNLRTFDGKPWRGSVDCLMGGYPCQPFSLAGRRLGRDDPRHLWPSIHRILGEVEPALCFFENVSAHLSLGFDEVARDLEGLGYQVAAGLWTAAEVGASHKRERLFILGYADRFDCHRRRASWLSVAKSTDAGVALADANSPRERQQAVRGNRERNWTANGGGSLDNADGAGRRITRDVVGQAGDAESGRPKRERLRHASGDRCDDVADTDDKPQSQQARRANARRSGITGSGNQLADTNGKGRQIQSGERCHSEQGWSPVERDCGQLVYTSRNGRREGRTESELRSGRDTVADSSLPIFPPGPGEFDRWRDILGEDETLAPAVSKIYLLANGLAIDRARLLRLFGNGVVPLQAAVAFCSLWSALRQPAEQPKTQLGFCFD